LGARDHYVVPRALHRTGQLAQLVTDAWSAPGTLASSIGSTLSTVFGQRFHPDLSGANVRALSASLIGHEIQWRLQRREGWDLVVGRNEWFQSEGASLLPQRPDGQRTMLFAYSYAAEAFFVEGKRRGWTTVLGQIDPGPEHVLTQKRLAAERPEFGPPPAAPPPGYFDHWRRECDLADRIVVNSEWSRASLLRAGIPERKLATIALPYESDANDAAERAYPSAFSRERPLRVLFVGTASVAKGVADLLLAFEQLADAPVELSIVGERAMDVPDRFQRHLRIRWHGRVDRALVMDHYRASDLLIFPSHSDGFGVTQIEGQAWGLPVVSSRNCGRVVRDGETGWLLDEVSPAAIAAALERAVREPQTLSRFARAARETPASGVQALAEGLRALENE